MTQGSEAQKRLVGFRAADEEVGDRMRVGLGTGSTAIHAVRRVGQRLSAGELRDVIAVPTSRQTRLECFALGIPVADLEDPRIGGTLDVVIDGTDEFDPEHRLIKGGGGAHTLEKIIAYAADRFVVVADAGKRVERLGERYPVPVEVIPAALAPVLRAAAALGARPVIREARAKIGPVISEHGNLIVDLHFAAAFDPAELARRLSEQPGVVEHGLFLRGRPVVYVAGADGTVRRED